MYKAIAAAAVTGVGVLYASEEMVSATGHDTPTLEMMETDKFDSFVREALLRNPNIMLEVFEILENQQASISQEADAELIRAAADSLFVGAADDAPVIVEFFDYNCGYCRRAHLEMQAIRERHDEVEFVHMHLPILGNSSTELAKTAMAVRQLYGDEAYNDLHARLMEDDGRMKARLTVELTQMGYDPEEIAEVANGSEVRDALDRAGQIARSLGISGTPAFVTRSQIMRGFVGRTELINAAF